VTHSTRDSTLAELWGPVPALDVPLRAGERVARIVSEQRGVWLAHDGAEPKWAGATGKLRRAFARAEALRPAVGDFVVLQAPSVHDAKETIAHVLPRRTTLARKAAGKGALEQVLAADVDVALIVCAMGRDVNPRRMERLLSIAWNGGVTPVIVLTKHDTVEDPQTYIDLATEVANGVAVHAVSVRTGIGIAALDAYLNHGQTLVVFGSSGAGKSTLINHWMGSEVLATGEVDEEGRGKHTSTSRQMLQLPQGAWVIDTPGIREVGLWGADEGIERSFEDVTSIIAQCKYSDCKHEREPGCALNAALASQQIDPVRVEAYNNLRAEQALTERKADKAVANRHRAQAASQTRALRARLEQKGRR
jgi:ribosome biogenesis GTPase / thiamine phosphate phosphatase